MKKILLSLAFIAFFAQVKGQTTWSYNFGTVTAGPYTSATMVDATTQGYPASAANGGTPYVRGTATDGTALVNTISAGGTAVELLLPNTTNTNKFSINAFSGTVLATLEFKVNFTGDGGRTAVYVGNGATFSAQSLTVAHVFSGLNFVPTASGTQTVGLSKLSGSSNIAFTASEIVSAPTINKGSSHVFKFYLNNGLTDVSYAYNGGNKLLLARTYDIYIDGVLSYSNVANGGDTNLLQNTVLNGLAFQAVVIPTTPTVNPAYRFDDLVYSNFLPAPLVLPVTFSQVAATKAGSNVAVNWTTASEANNDHFEIEASTDGKTFKTIKTVKTKNGNSSQIQEYQENVTLTDIAGVLALPLLLGFIGFSPASRRRKVAMLLVGATVMATSFVACQKEGKDLTSLNGQDRNSIINGQKTIYIRIKQVDKNGDFSYSNIVAAK